jgi:hypothetical protein
MSPSWSRLSKTEAKPVNVPLASSAPLINSDADLCCIESLSGQRNRRIDKRPLAATGWRYRSDRSRRAGEVQFGPWPLAGDAPSLIARAGPGAWEPAKSCVRA